MVSRKSDLIKGYSRGLDLSPEGLRYYERKGIVHPERDPDSGYRYYSFPDTVAVTTCKKMRCFGYSLEEASDAFKNLDFEEQTESLKKHQHSLEKEIERQKLVLKRMKEAEKASQDALENLEKARHLDLPPLYFLPTRIRQETIHDQDLLDQITLWNKAQPFPEIVLLNDEKETVTGIVVNKEYKEILNLPWQEELPAFHGTSVSLIQNMKELENGNYRRKAEQILKQSLNHKRIMAVLLSASMQNEEMKVLCRILIPD